MYTSRNKENPGKEQRPREERLALPHMRGYYKASIIKSLILAQRQADRQTRKESPEIDPIACENLVYHKRDPGSSGGKESTCNIVDPDLIPGLGKIPWRREWQPTPVFLSGEFHGQRSLAGYIVYGVTKSWTRLSD